MTTFSEKKKFVLESGLTLLELRQIISELEEDAAQAETDGINNGYDEFKSCFPEAAREMRFT